MKKLAQTYPKLARRQNGAVLIIGLIFLVVLTLIVMSALRSATFQERMAANARNQQQAFEAAEALLRDASTTLFSRNGLMDKYDPKDFSTFGALSLGCTNGLCQTAAAGVERWRTYNWGSATLTKTFSVSTLNIKDISTNPPPRYFVEVVDPPLPTSNGSGGGCNYGIFNVTARAVARDSAVALVQGTYKFKPQIC